MTSYLSCFAIGSSFQNSIWERTCLGNSIARLPPAKPAKKSRVFFIKASVSGRSSAKWSFALNCEFRNEENDFKIELGTTELANKLALFRKSSENITINHLITMATATVDDFLQKFSGPGTTSDDQAAQQAAQYHDKFVSTAPQDQEFDQQQLNDGATEYLGKLPDDQFQKAASNAYEGLPQQQQQGLVGSLLGALQGQGVGMNTLANNLGLSSDNPQNLTGDDYARIANYARHEKPEAMKAVIREKPFWLRALGHPILMGALAMVASRMVRNRMR